VRKALFISNLPDADWKLAGITEKRHATKRERLLKKDFSRRKDDQSVLADGAIFAYCFGRFTKASVESTFKVNSFSKCSCINSIELIFKIENGITQPIDFFFLYRDIAIKSTI
jgi:hypothetical protein